MEVKYDRFLRQAEAIGSWADFAVHCMGECDSGEPTLDEAIRNLYEANEAVHRISNKLALRHDVEFFEGKSTT